MATFVIDTMTSGDNTIVAGVANKTINVTSLVLVCNAAQAVQWWSGPAASGTEMSGSMSFPAGSGYALQPSVVGLTQFAHLKTQPGGFLNLNLGSASVQVSGHGTYEYAGV